MLHGPTPPESAHLVHSPRALGSRGLLSSPSVTGGVRSSIYLRAPAHRPGLSVSRPPAFLGPYDGWAPPLYFFPARKHRRDFPVTGQLATHLPDSSATTRVHI
jgi:hypothetical protein